MTTPKSPEQVVKEFLTDFPATNDSDSKELSMYQRKVMKEYIRSSMSSLLCYMAERIGKHKEGEGRWCDTGEDMDWECRSECVESARSVLIDEARKIAKDMILNEMQPTEERIRQAATEAAEDQNKMLEEARKIVNNE